MHFRRVWLFIVICVIAPLVPGSAFACAPYTVCAPPSCPVGQIPVLNVWSWVCQSQAAINVPTAPTCPTGQLPVLTGTVWICEPSTSTDAQQEQQQMTWIETSTYFNTYPCGPGYTGVIDPRGYGGFFDFCSPNTDVASVEQALAQEEPMFSQYYALQPLIQQQVVAAAVAAQIAAQNAAILAASTADNTKVGNVLCKISKWTSGNTGKGLAIIFVCVLGIAIALKKISVQTTLLILVGIAVIFGATAIVNALGGSNFSCATNSPLR
jgi:type IV secretory pathway VirB2 component (pilin)